MTSLQNTFKHSLSSTHLVTAGENPAALDSLKADLRREHQPANTTEEILVNEMAEQFWRIRRYRERETGMLRIDASDAQALAILQFLTVIQRMTTAAERGFHKALATLRQLQKDRGFVPQSSETAEAKGEIKSTAASGFVPQNAPRQYSPETNAWFARNVADGTYAPDDFEMCDLFEEDLASAREYEAAKAASQRT